MIAISTEERRSRLGLRHHLAVPAKDIATVASDLAGLHSSDPATVYLAAWARVEGFSPDDLARALYEDKTLVRMLGMRRTMFVVTREGAATMDAACTKAVVAPQTKRLAGLIEDSGIADDGEAWVQRVGDATMQALAGRGEATAGELSDDIPELKEKFRYGQGTFGISTRVLFLLATEGRIVRGRPLGSWRSSQYRWVPTEAWLGGPLPELDPATARASLLSQWLRAFGPGTELDLKWWTGWNLGQARRALADAGAVEVDLDGRSGYVLPDDVATVAELDDWVALLPGLDPTVMGWKQRDWYLGDHAEELFDRNGNAGPTVWWNGRVVGGWAQRPDGEIAVELLEPVPKTTQAMIDSRVAQLTEWLDGVVVTPRFRTPLERRLAEQ